MRNKAWRRMLAALMLLLNLSGWYEQGAVHAAPSFAGGTGLPEDPYLIANASQLNHVRDYLDKSFKLTADIDLTIYSAGNGWQPIGDGATVTNRFTGTMDGNGFKITNLKINRTNQFYLSLFGVVEGAHITNMRLEGVDIAGSGGNYAGGLAGIVLSGTIEQTYVTGRVALISDPSNNAGQSVGGLVGENYGVIKNSYSTVEVSGWTTVGGLVGYHTGTIENSYAAALVTGDGIGGLVASNNGGTITSSYYDKETAGIPDEEDWWELGKSRADMKDQVTYSGWDFTAIWGINPAFNGGYPFFPTNSSITPTSASFDKYTAAADYADVAVTLSSNGNTLSSIKNGGAALVAGTDYTVSGNTATIKKSYLSAQPEGTVNLIFAFSWGTPQTLAITVNDTSPPNSTMSPTSANFDKNVTSAVYADVTVALSLNGNTLSSITNGGAALVLGTDYEMAGNTVTVKKTYLSALPLGTTTLTFHFNNGLPQMLAVDASDTTPVPPGPPALQSAAAGDKEVTLHWSPVMGSTGYHIYQSVTSGTYGTETASVSSDVYTYTAAGLTNGTTYYFVVKALNVSGEGAASNQLSATPKGVPAAPTQVAAVAGIRQATVSFTVPADNGGSDITGYEVTASPGDIVAAGNESPITVTGLAGGTSYTFTVKAINGIGGSESSVISNAVVPWIPSSSSGGSAPSSPAASAPSTPEAANTGVDVLVNGKAENAGTATVSQVNNRSVTTVHLDADLLAAKLAAEGPKSIITIPVRTASDVVIGELDGQMVKNMEQLQAVLELKSDKNVYKLSALQMNIDAISGQLGGAVNLQDIKIQLEIARPAADTATIMENAANKGNFTIVAPPVNFTVRAIYGERTIEVSKFNIYVERLIAIPEGVDPNKITTGVVADPDGMVRHVPTKIIVIDGLYYAQINSLTNSMYSVVWHPLEFADVAYHWAKNAVNDMGSRMVVDGTGGGLFTPDREITRAEFAAIVVRGLGLKPENGAAQFSDVKASDWYADAVNTAYSYGLIHGFGDGTFRPHENITREQAMLIVAEALKITGLKAKLPVQDADSTLRVFADQAEASGWARSGVADSVQAGIVTGRSTAGLAPKGYVTRAEVAAIMQRLLQTSGLI
ncbi:X2-like carbohydrate binding domain-containing protein [Paenibacillus thalictri]|nr:X2-like carbohydrate binding domain-containing protein [Paenibacillus thalictri]